MGERVHDPIAIVGIGCRFPGGADDPEHFWRQLRDGIDAIGPIPRDRFDAESLYAPAGPTPGRISTRWGGFLSDVDRFDAGFFGISPREAERMDPQQRLLLEVSWEALEDGGHTPDMLAALRTGVFVGLWTDDYETRSAGDVRELDLYLATGSGRYAASGRISYAFDLRGPSITIDTACSSSLVAVHQACRSIWSGECDAALAGGANVILDPYITIAYSQAGMLARDGRCKFGDHRADGYVRSEGAGMILLKRLSRALADHDRIHATILGSAVNNDGERSASLMTPSVAGQKEMLRLAYEDARVSPASVSYIEAHGTGTRAGDPVELEAIGAVIGHARPADRPCPVGSLKAHVGHTESAAGVGGLIRTALILRHREVPATLHREQPNPEVPWAELGLFVPSEPVPLDGTDAPVIAGVSSFGISGTNAHVVLGEHVADGGASRARETVVPQRAVLLPLSARSEAALKALGSAWADYVASSNDLLLDDLAFTAAQRRTHHACRRAVVARDRDQLLNGLRGIANGEPAGTGPQAGPWVGTPGQKAVFVFPGQGSQWVGMGRQLLDDEPVFREALERCEAAMRPFVHWSLLHQLGLEESDADFMLGRIDVIQPTLVAFEIGLAALWRSWGIEPAAVVGHSMGEVAAAYVAGALSLEDAMRVICLRSSLLRRLEGTGAMALVELSLAEIETRLGACGSNVSVAASNSRRSVILSGAPGELETLLEDLGREGVFCRMVNVDVASHSVHVEPLLDELTEALAAVRPIPEAIPFYSTVRAEPISGEALDASYWAANLRKPVLFGEAVERIAADGHNAFIEATPHPILLPAMQQTLADAGSGARAFGSLRRGEEERSSLLHTLGELYALGFSPVWERVQPDGRFIPVPRYPWQRERFWFEPSVGRRNGSRGSNGNGRVAGRARWATGSGTWEFEVSTETHPYLADHRVRGRMVLPAAEHLAWALDSAESWGGTARIENLSIGEAILPGADAGSAPTIQVMLDPDTPEAAMLSVFSRTRGAGADDWSRHARGRILRGLPPALPADDEIVPGADDFAAGAEPAESFYADLAARGIEYGPSFRAVERIHRAPRSAFGWIRLPEAVQAEEHGRRVHPVLLDGCLQLVLGTLQDGVDPRDPYVPVSIERLYLYDTPAPAGRYLARAIRRTAGAELVGDVTLLTGDGRPVLQIRGARFQRLPAPRSDLVAEGLRTLEWHRRPLPAGTDSSDPVDRWLLVGDGAGLADALCSRLAARGASPVRIRPGERFRPLASGDFEADLVSREGFDRVLEAIDAAENGTYQVVYLVGADADSGGDPAQVAAAHASGSAGLLRLIQSLVARELAGRTRLAVITAGAQAVGATESVPGLAHAGLWGMTAVAANEHPALACRCIDVDPTADQRDATTLLRAIVANDLEDRVALRGGERFGLRCLPLSLAAGEDIGMMQRAIGGSRQQSYRVVSKAPGVLDNLVHEPLRRQRPTARQVEIEVRATGLNFMNVLSALGTYPGYPRGLGPLGIECAGIVSAVGQDVAEFRIGDRVVAFAHDALATHAVADARLVAAVPDGLRIEDAATIPIAFLTASYALEHLGRMEAGERVLIHSGAGGVGLAAFQLARRAGLEVYATAGSEDRREYLRSLGVNAVFDSRSLDFADQLLDETGGEGVDLVLNSLTGEAVVKGLSILRPYGRFLELGKRDIYGDSRISLGPFRKQLSYFAIDLERQSRERPDQLGRMLRVLMDRFESGELRPLPSVEFPSGEVVTAFRHMAEARHIGKVVLSFADTAAVSAAVSARTPVRSDATYLITGGTGGLGIEVADWMVSRGARHLVLASRSGGTSRTADRVRELEAAGAEVRVIAADVSRVAEVQRLLEEVHAEMPPLRGVIHAAGVLADATIMSLETARLNEAAAPKVSGALNLDRLTSHLPLDFFVLFSSVAGVLGTPGQANYAAGNVFLDALAHARRARGAPALSIDWGPWSTVGLAAAREDRGSRLAAQGLESISPNEGIEVLGILLGGSCPAQVMVARLDVERWVGAQPAAERSPLLSDLRPSRTRAGEDGADPAATVVTALAAAAAAERERLLRDLLRERAARVLRMAPDDVALNRPLKTLGLDSLMTLELRNRLEADLGLGISATVIWNHPTITLLARHLSDRVKPSVADEPTTTAAAVATAGATADGALESLERGDLQSLLETELAAVDERLA